MNLEAIQAYVTLIKDILTGLAALTAAVIGIIGLQTWKKQLRGKTEYELAQRLATAVYKIRNVIDDLTSMCDYDLVVPQYPGKAPHAKSSYDNRLQQYKEVVAEADSLLLEAEVIWGAYVREVFAPFQLITGNSFHRLEDYATQIEELRVSLEDEAVSRKRKETSEDFKRLTLRNKSIQDTTVREIEDFLKPYLKI